MFTETVSRMSSSSKNSLGNSWETVWIPYHNGVDGTPTIPFTTNTIRSEDSASKAPGLSWNSRRALLDRASFIKQDEDGSLAAKK